MPVIPAATTRKVLVAWAVLIAAGFLAAEGLTAWLARHGQILRANDYRTYLGFAADFVEKNDFQRALAQTEEAKRKARHEPAPYEVAGDIHYRLKQWDKAIVEYDRAFARNSSAAGPRLNKVWALIELGRNDEAAAFGRQAMDEGYRSPAMARFVAEACFRAGKHAEAIPYYEEALQGYPNDLYLLEHLRQCFAATGRPDRAREMSDRIADVEASINRIAASGS